MNYNEFAHDYLVGERQRKAVCRRLGVHESYRGDDAPANPAVQNLSTGIKLGHVSPREISVQKVFEATVTDSHNKLCGRELVNSWRRLRPDDRNRLSVYESGVSTAAFSNIMGQILFRTTMEEFEKPELIGMSMVETISSEFAHERIPGMTMLGDYAAAVKEGHDYPIVGLDEDWIITPETEKYGFIVPITREAIFYDRTGLLLRRAAQVGEYLAINREKRALDAICGITNTYQRKNRGYINTYGDSSGRGFDNLSASTPLVDYTSLKTLDDMFDNMVDPQDGEPIVLSRRQLLHPTALRSTVKRIQNAVEVRELTNSGDRETLVNGNQLQYDFEAKTNQYVKERTSSNSTWFYGDFPGAFAYVENWAPDTVQAPSNSHDEFHRDIAVQYKISERGVMAVKEPRKVIKATA